MPLFYRQVWEDPQRSLSEEQDGSHERTIFGKLIVHLFSLDPTIARSAFVLPLYTSLTSMITHLSLQRDGLAQ